MQRTAQWTRRIPMTFGGGTISGLCWLELWYRYRLYHRYGGGPFLNHVSNGYFAFMYSVAALAALLVISGLLLRTKRLTISVLVARMVLVALPIAFDVTLSSMHEWAMLVTYSEYADNLGP